MPTGQTRRYVEEVCSNCGKKFDRRAEAPKVEFVFCGNACARAHMCQQRTNATRKRILEAIESLYGTNYGTGDLVRLTGFHPETVRFHLKAMREERAT